MSEDENSKSPDRGARDLLGTLLLALGGTIGLLIAADELGGLPFSMPRSWYQNRPLWIGAAVVGFMTGFLLQRPPKGDEQDTT